MAKLSFEAIYGKKNIWMEHFAFIAVMFTKEYNHWVRHVQPVALKTCFRSVSDHLGKQIVAF